MGLGKNRPYLQPMSHMDLGESWAAWLREQFDRSPTIKSNADLVRASGIKPNGRPVIDASTVTQWLRGRRPSFQLAVAAAEAFRVPAVGALSAAGYEVEARRDVEEASVGGRAEDAELEDDLLYRRPEGLTDQEWEQIKKDARGYLEWQIDKAARER